MTLRRHRTNHAASAGPGWLPEVGLFCAVVSLLAGQPLRAESATPAPPAPDMMIRFGYHRDLVRGVNETDFQSAMLVYSRVIAQVANVPAETRQQLFFLPEQIIDALRHNEINLLAAPTQEILSLPPGLVDEKFIVSATQGQLGVEYIILVHAESDIHQLADLSGRTLTRLDNSQNSLAQRWLDCLLARQHLPRSSTFLRQIKPAAKPPLAILPVFFHQADACLVSRTSYSLLCELNPQLSRQLRVLVESPRYITTLTAFRAGMPPQLQAAVIQAILTIQNSPAGRQLLTLYQTESLVLCTSAELTATRELLTEHERLFPRPPLPFPPPPER